MNTPLRVLILEDSKADADLMVAELRRAGYEPDWVRVETEEDYKAQLASRYDIVLADYRLPNFDGAGALRLLNGAREKVPLIIVSGTIGDEEAAGVIKLGAADFLLKDRMARLGVAVAQALSAQEQQAKLLQTQEALRRSEERIRVLWETTTDAVVLINADNRIELANPAVKQVFGHTPEELTGKDVSILQPARLRDAHRRGMQRYLQSGVRTFDWSAKETVGLHRHGHEFPIEIVFNHIKIGDIPLFAGFIRDITERQLAEKKLRESELRFRQLAENIQEVFWLSDPSKSEILYISPAYEKVWGRSSDTLYASPRSWADAIHPEDRSRILEAAQTKQARGDYIEEYRIVRPDGSVCWVRDKAFPVLDKEGRVFRIAGIAEDITQRKQFEEEIRETRNFLASIFDNIPNSIFIKDAQDLRFVRANTACEKLTGFSEKELLGKSDYDFFPKEQADFFVAKDRETLAGNRRVNIIEETITSRDGTEKWLQTKKIPILDANGQPRYLLGMSEDITERKRSEEALRESEYRLDLALAASGLATWEWTFATRQVRFSQHWWPILGYRPDDVPMRIDAWEKLTHPDDLERVKSMVAAVAKGSAPVLEVEYRMQSKNAGWRWIRTVGRVVERDSAGRVLRMTGTHGDITEIKLSEQRLRESEAKYRGLIEQASDGIFVSDAEGNFVLVNTRGCELLGYEEHELLGLNGRQTYLEQDAQTHAERMQQVGAGEVLRFERMIKRKDGSVFPAEISLKKLDNGTVQVIFHDITTRRNQEQKIARLSRIQGVLSAIDSAIVRIREQQELLNEACRIAVELGGFRMAWIGLVDKGARKVVPVAQAGFQGSFFGYARLSIEDDAFEGQGPVGRAIRGKVPVVTNDIETAPQMVGRQEQLDLGLRSKVALPLLVGNEAVGTLSLYASEPGFFDDEEMKLLLELASDISFAMEYIEKEERLNHLAYYDALTGLANNTLFHDRLGQFVQAAKRSKERVAAILINLDRFRQLNDTLGRHAGDTLLKMVAQRLGEVLREPVSLARIGADSFAIAIADIKHEDDVANILRDRVFPHLAGPFELNGVQIRVLAKAGVALYPGDGNDAETLFRNAEAALKQAKSSGERYLFYAPEMNARVAEKLTLENKLRQGFERGEFVLHYQPKVDVASRKTVGLEALIRWNDPQSGLVAPAQFIPLLEETGMILEVGLWAIRQALEECRLWREKGLKPPRVAVNVSALQLQQKNFVDAVRQTVRAFGGEPYELDLEITESLIMHDIEGNIGKLAALKAMGINIAIDDFGTGYSSLSYLAMLPVNALKIDRSFIVGMNSSAESATIVSTIVSLAHSLGLKVIAEGVENEEQAKTLRLLKCDEMQGFFISRPIPPDGIAAFISH